MKEVEAFRQKLYLPLSETISILRNINRRAEGKIILQQHLYPNQTEPYFNFDIEVKSLKFQNNVILMNTSAGKLELVIKPYLQDKVTSRLTYCVHKKYGGWWFEIGGIRFIFQCSYTLIMEDVLNEKGSSQSYIRNDQYTNRLFDTVCVGEGVK